MNLSSLWIEISGPVFHFTFDDAARKHNRPRIVPQRLQPGGLFSVQFLILSFQFLLVKDGYPYTKFIKPNTTVLLLY
ncbi:hypothetical protein A4D02_10970 [Niastella koreensis]|uniref:Uncharacterized protein n=1 Tax=Niastella koreensis TaxID=354356 RepID=A0ABX3NRD6_9BACT|nr:hypothetical protein A4D02_10970 [Niastella koreensis]